MLGRIRRHHDFWSGSASHDESDLDVGPALDDVTPGSGEGWRDLWERDAEPTDQATWDAFFAGDTGNRREVDWLLSA